MATARIDLHQVSILAELVLRGGNFTHPGARRGLMEQYARPNLHYPDVFAGLSCLFRPGASLDELAREGAYRNAKLSVAILQRLMAELARVECEALLYVTPVGSYPDHHTLAVARQGRLQMTLDDPIVDALIRAMTVVDNPYQSGRP